jgi:sugar phosphate isomerase/epimerase
MKLGISSYTYTWAIGVPGSIPAQPLTALGLLDKVTALGVSVAQVADNLPLDALPAEELDAFCQAAQKRQISVEVGTRGIAPEHLLYYLDMAQQLGSPMLRVVIDTATHKPDEAEVISTLKSIINAFEQRCVCLAIENHDRFSAMAFARIVEGVGSSAVGICLDTVNSFGALEGPEVVVDTLRRYVVNLHVKDFSIRRASHMMGFTIEGRPAGQGRLNVPWLLEQLAAVGRDPNAILELWTPPADDLTQTIQTEDTWAHESVAYLRQYIPN